MARPSYANSICGRALFIERVKMENKPAYYAVIPARVRYADITANAKLLYGEVTALSNEKGYCWASNAHFAKLYKVSEKQVSLWFKQLADKKFVEIELIKNQSGTLRKVYVMEEKVIRVLQKGNVRNTVGTLPKGNTNNKLNIKNNNTDGLAEKKPAAVDHREAESPAKERIRQALRKGNLRSLKNA